MSDRGLVEGLACPICSLGGSLGLQMTSEADVVDGRTVVVHGVPTLVCDRCGIELYDEETTCRLEGFYEHAAQDRARTIIVDYEDLHSSATTSLSEAGARVLLAPGSQ